MNGPRLPGGWSWDSDRDPTPEFPDALCRQVLWPDAWHPTTKVNNHTYREPRQVCQACPELMPCAAYAIARPSLTGIWGALTEKDRTDIRAGRKAPPWG